MWYPEIYVVVRRIYVVLESIYVVARCIYVLVGKLSGSQYQ